MMWNSAKKIIWLLFASTILSSLFSAAMIVISMKMYKDILFLRRRLSNTGDNGIRFQKYRQP
ncbi:Uncharacterised protein [Niallia circulans]|uniref:Uncharacterized protein n=2 Tax=Niallia circulans TaxID=1397 RepID=A0A0J1IJ74_NIACI|nr:hypothetical protein [Niallia circulans]KLV25994.1 hypothetical protein ABW02_12975 [Niallia circulans]MCM2983567.1 hypothetical protein [Niallia circulans]MDR4317716.1 hypothetical protein [Niallia circulans]MED3841150.1 hypothetical protein [Niallia circulans]MED4245727.1 hypothetical protein [Niallia circulans]